MGKWPTAIVIGTRRQKNIFKAARRWNLPTPGKTFAITRQSQSMRSFWELGNLGKSLGSNVGQA
jgi:hypothetical protein